MKLNLRQIEVFRAIMLSGSISGASKLLYVSQPAVSRLIAYTEQRLGLQLFERIKGRLYPTPEARRLFEEVSTLYQSVQRVNEVAENLAHNREGHIRIACSPSIGQSLMPLAVAHFTQRTRSSNNHELLDLVIQHLPVQPFGGGSGVHIFHLMMAGRIALVRIVANPGAVVMQIK